MSSHQTVDPDLYWDTDFLKRKVFHFVHGGTKRNLGHPGEIESKLRGFTGDKYSANC